MVPAIILAGCGGASPPGPGAGATFPSHAFEEAGGPGVLQPSTTATTVGADPASTCPGATTCRLSAPGEPLDMVRGRVVFEYRVNASGLTRSALTGAQVVGAVRAAAAEWMRHDTRIELVFRGTTGAPAGTPGVVAFGAPCGHGRFPACTDLTSDPSSVTFSAAAPWTWRSCGPGGDGTPCTPYPQHCTVEGSVERCEGIDLQAVATHEWGHVLGLDDLTSTQADGLTMFGRAAVSDDRGALVRRDLSTIGVGDLDGLRRLYPGSTTARPIVTP